MVIMIDMKMRLTILTEADFKRLVNEDCLCVNEVLLLGDDPRHIELILS
jgi:hypothetical protein